MPSRETKGENMLVATNDTKKFWSTLKWGHKGVRKFSPKRLMRHHINFVIWWNMCGKGAVGQAGTITACLFGKKPAFKEFIEGVILLYGCEFRCRQGRGYRTTTSKQEAIQGEISC